MPTPKPKASPCETAHAVRKPVNGSRILLIGLAYKANVDDMRESPTFVLMDELQRRGAAGRRAEILGASALAGDKTARDRRLPDAELLRMYQAIPAEHQAMMQAYVDGINRAVAEVLADPERKTPLEFIVLLLKNMNRVNQ